MSICVHSCIHFYIALFNKNGLIGFCLYCWYWRWILFYDFLIVLNKVFCLLAIKINFCATHTSLIKFAFFKIIFWSKQFNSHLQPQLVSLWNTCWNQSNSIRNIPLVSVLILPPFFQSFSPFFFFLLTAAPLLIHHTRGARSHSKCAIWTNPHASRLWRYRFVRQYDPAGV